MIQKLKGWKHFGFSVDNGVRISKEDEKGSEAIAQYIICNVFSTGKITYIEKTKKVIYRSRMQKGKNKKDFMVYTNEESIAAITQYIPKKNFHIVRYDGWYSNKSRGM